MIPGHIAKRVVGGHAAAIGALGTPTAAQKARESRRVGGNASKDITEIEYPGQRRLPTMCRPVYAWIDCSWLRRSAATYAASRSSRPSSGTAWDGVRC